MQGAAPCKCGTLRWLSSAMGADIGALKRIRQEQQKNPLPLGLVSGSNSLLHSHWWYSGHSTPPCAVCKGRQQAISRTLPRADTPPRCHALLSLHPPTWSNSTFQPQHFMDILGAPVSSYTAPQGQGLL